VDIYKLLHRLGGEKGVIRQAEFFLYTKKDQDAVNEILSLGYRYPEVTGWVRPPSPISPWPRTSG